MKKITSIASIAKAIKSAASAMVMAIMAAAMLGTGLLAEPGQAAAQSAAYYPYGPCYNFTSDLQIGSTGPAVEALHNILAREGFNRSNSWSVSNQVYNEETASLVSGLQERYASEILTPAGLRYGTGFVGSRTRSKLNALCGTAGGNTNNGYTPSISNLSAPSTLRTGENGTWSLTATDPQNRQLTYYVSWGDEAYLSYPVSGATVPSTSQYDQRSTFTHVYNNPGTYTVTFRARNTLGYEAQTSATVYVTSNGSGNGDCWNGSYYTNCGTTNTPRVISPNGNQWLQKGSYTTLQWQLPNVQYFAAQAVDVNMILVSSSQYPYTTGAAYQQGYSTCPVGSTCAYNPNQPSYPYYGDSAYLNQYYQNQYNQYGQYSTKYNILQNTTLNTYNWYVGSTPTGWSTMVSGSYLMQVCLSGTNTCDVSDSTFMVY